MPRKVDEGSEQIAPKDLRFSNFWSVEPRKVMKKKKGPTTKVAVPLEKRMA
jgi:hypothetical protein